MKKILITGGGVSGGHAMSLVSLVQEIRSTHSKEDVSFLWIGSKHGIERRKAETFDIRYRAVSAGKWRRYFSFDNIIDWFRIPIGIFQSLFFIAFFRPQVTFAAGGYASVPASIASWILRIPLVIHENDVAPGLANRLLARLAQKVLISYEKTRSGFIHDDVVLTGLPLRKDIQNGKAIRARKHFGLTDDLPVFLVIGGGQGSLQLNEIIVESLNELIQFCQVIHICGEKNYITIDSVIPEDLPRYHLVPYLENELKDVYAVADLALTRAGAHSLNELSHHAIPMLIVPHGRLSSGHQSQNAQLLQEHRAAFIYDEDNLTSGMLVSKAKELLFDIEKLKRMGQNAQNHVVPRAREKIAKEIFNVLEKNDKGD